MWRSRGLGLVTGNSTHLRGKSARCMARGGRKAPDLLHGMVVIGPSDLFFLDTLLVSHIIRHGGNLRWSVQALDANAFSKVLFLVVSVIVPKTVQLGLVGGSSLGLHSHRCTDVCIWF